MKEQLQSYIYTEKLLAQLYRRAAALSTVQAEKQVLLDFAKGAEQNAIYLNNLYRQEFGTNFDPMIPDAVIQGNYRDVLNEILKQELASFLDYRRQTYNQQNLQFRDTMLAITDTKLAHSLTLLSIISNMNTPGSERIQNFPK